MVNYGKLREILDDMEEQGYEFVMFLHDELDEDGNSVNDISRSYQEWYSKALIIVKKFIPERLNEFKQLYRDEKRKHLSASTYTISDALMGVESIEEDWPNPYGPKNAAVLIAAQTDILLSCLGVIESKVSSIQATLLANVFDSELESAKNLQKKGFLRAAGAICEVVLEKHLASVSNDRKISVGKSKRLPELNDALKDRAYDVAQWRKIQYLCDICKLCDLSKDREPGSEEIDELIAGTNRVIKTVF